ncbi:hypothetical protein CIG75_00385 [Tumebacillus algifaecis]|uniref:Uncharacterized protein n=1 Tax=Tumebacillus algifaecis TaxID=1214604 RepID=A0A223CWA9_9BACL|nr:hypothetical protein [Tumebacillus algifaecis]ASS73581.1 hypothetical protein CIG75_00385 [Tumebacillus algifaecis]
MTSNAYPQLNTYADLIVQTHLPPLLTPPDWYGDFATEFAHVKSRALSWRRTLLWKLSELTLFTHQISPRLATLEQELAALDDHLKQYRFDQVANKRRKLTQARLTEQKQAVLHIYLDCLRSLQSFHEHLLHDRLLLMRGAQEGWDPFPDLVRACDLALGELAALLLTLQTKKHYLKGDVLDDHTGSCASP